ncbi:MAG: Asp-tRNA(Asn)/Glu-tRNA(Gln) amidotransferase subunit GatC [Candidatus Improbicoccus pseudotrichonymphae]|uniref:Asp-tRNA(Asn)/Glu-tRNA(Gln) amidotransferase subunit GatC n=1 Tax=Candidatus Improbicoccus pseudotrichonymphae TaxID=3033792 RepID=A0AA48I1U1_9FIRM|nr:MAG: Asp-tRNA(Asn)/Glu-tRNA(Gln) amidotransferase subunit GatC [Candidatus Improbicoccus pseudotrichonymphae]
MVENINREKILKLIKISKLSLSEEKLKKIIKDMKNIIDFVNQVNDFSENESEEKDYIKNKTKGYTREDVCGESVSQFEAVRSALESEDGFFVVKNSRQ